MAERSNKVRWCLRKAEKEVALGKAHRGLLKIEPDVDGARDHIKKAEHNIKAMMYFAEGGFSDWSASAAFYAVYHCFLAVIRKHGYESRNQECTIALLDMLKGDGVIDIESSLVDSLKAMDSQEVHDSNIIALMENFQYGTETMMKDDKLNELKSFCMEAIKGCREIVNDG